MSLTCTDGQPALRNRSFRVSWGTVLKIWTLSNIDHPLGPLERMLLCDDHGPPQKWARVLG